jgi:NADPH-dependent ferric siderophore reductase
MTLTVASTDAIAANDTINVVGLTRAHNGVYSVRSVDTAAKTVLVDLYSRTNGSVSAASYNSPAIVGTTARLFVSDADEDLAIKDAIIEGGGLYTLKITSLSALFN